MTTIGDFESNALKLIYEAADEFVRVNGNVTLKEVTIYLNDEPISGIRGIQLENLDATAKALAEAGWITMKTGGNAIEVHLTDAGISAARHP